MYADSRKRSHGFTLVELMVGVLLALLIGIAATSTVMLYTAAQRTGLSSSVADANTTSVLSAIAEDIAQAGLGFIPPQAPYVCDTLDVGHGNTATTLSSFWPLRITSGPSVDSIELLYGSEVSGGVTMPLAAATGLTSVDTTSHFPVDVGQAVLLSPDPTSTARTCTIRTTTAVNSTTTLDQTTVSMGNGGIHNQASFARAASYGAKDRISLIGNLEWHRYRVVNGDLVIDWPMTGTSAVILRNVVAFKVMYGVAPGSATGGRTTTVTSWSGSTGSWATSLNANPSQLRAIQLGVLIRSSEPQRPKPGVSCDATPTSTPPSLMGALPVLPAGWDCFSYRSATITAPLRNLAWGMN